MLSLCLALTALQAEDPAASPPRAYEEILAAECHQDLFGVSVEPAHDGDGDGLHDLWVGDLSGIQTGGLRGQVWLVSSVTGRALLHVAAPEGVRYFGTTLAGLPDLNGDGVRDLAIGGPFVSTPEHPDFRVQPEGRGAVFLVSGADGTMLRTWLGPADWFKNPWYTSGAGPALASIGDWDGDGVADLAIGWSNATRDEPEQGCVQVVSGKDGSVLQETYGTAAHDRFGYALASIDDHKGMPRLVASALPDRDERDEGSETPKTVRPGHVRVLSPEGVLVGDIRAPDGNPWFGFSLAWIPPSPESPGVVAVGQSFSWSPGQAVHFITPHDGRRVGGFARPEGFYKSFGSRVVPVRDFDEDGLSDVVVTDPQSWITYPGVFSRADGSLVKRIELGELPGIDDLEDHAGPSHVGIASAKTDDLDGDGVEDFVLGGASIRCGGCLGAVVLYSGKDATPIRWFTRRGLG